MKLKTQVLQCSYRKSKRDTTRPKVEDAECESFKRLCTHTISHEQQIQLHNKNVQSPDGNKNWDRTETGKRHAKSLSVGF